MTAPTFEKDRVLAGVVRALAKVLDAAADLGVGLPARQVAAAAAVPFDCEEVLAYAINIRTGAPESRSGAGTYPNPGAEMTLYYLTAQLTIVRNTATLGSTPAQGVSQIPPDPSAYLTNLTSASSDAAVLIFAADKLQTEDSWAGVGAVTRQVTFSAPQGGLVATSCALTLVI